MKVLIPLLSKQENKPEFLQRAVQGAKEVLLLLVIDTESTPSQFGFVASEIGQGNTLMQDVKKQLEKMRKTCNDVIEWGNTETKIEHIAQLQHVDKIVLLKQDNQFFKKLLKQMRGKLKMEIRVLSVS